MDCIALVWIIERIFYGVIKNTTDGAGLNRPFRMHGNRVLPPPVMMIIKRRLKRSSGVQLLFRRSMPSQKEAVVKTRREFKTDCWGTRRTTPSYLNLNLLNWISCWDAEQQVQYIYPAYCKRRVLIENKKILPSIFCHVYNENVLCLSHFKCTNL